MLLSVRGAFFLSFCTLLIFSFFLPGIKLLFFVPTLIISLYRKRLLVTFWHAIFCGVVCDLFSSSTFFGTSSLGYAFMIALLSRLKRHFFDDHLSTLPFLTFLFGLFYPFVEMIIHLFFPAPFFFSPRWFLTDVLLMSCADALFAFLLFSLPVQLYNRKSKHHMEEG